MLWQLPYSSKGFKHYTPNQPYTLYEFQGKYLWIHSTIREEKNKIFEKKTNL